VEILAPLARDVATSGLTVTAKLVEQQALSLSGSRLRSCSNSSASRKWLASTAYAGLRPRTVDGVGNSYHSTIARYVETNARPRALIEFGRYPVFPPGRPGLKVLGTVESSAFRETSGPIAALLPDRMAHQATQVRARRRREYAGLVA
jgi:hypothetical protein